MDLAILYLAAESSLVPMHWRWGFGFDQCKLRMACVQDQVIFAPLGNGARNAQNGRSIGSDPLVTEDARGRHVVRIPAGDLLRRDAFDRDPVRNVDSHTAMIFWRL